MRLPEGFAELRDDLGEIIRHNRLNYQNDGRLRQSELAALVGISRESLSRIERGHGWPNYDTLHKIMGLLDLEWDMVATRGKTARPSRHYAPEYLQDLCSALRAGRLQEGLTLQDLAKKTGISCSQLSRIERAQITRSRKLQVVETGSGRQLDEYTVFRFTHPELDRLARMGWSRPVSMQT